MSDGYERIQKEAVMCIWRNYSIVSLARVRKKLKISVKKIIGNLAWN